MLHVDTDTIYSWEYHKTSSNPRRLPEIISFLGGEPDIQIRKFCGEKIRAYRRLHALSQRQLAVTLDVHRPTLQQYENSKRDLSE